MTDINGTLRNARRLSEPDGFRGGPRLRGQIYGDTKNRFDDGEWIITSQIKSEDGDVFKTTFSTYRVESWAATGGGGGPIPPEWGSAGTGSPDVVGRESPANDNTSERAAAINDLVTYFHKKSTDAGWWKDPATGTPLAAFDWHNYVVATKLMLCVSELSEAMEGLRKNLMDDKLPHRKMAEVELGDALIRICDLAGELGYDLGGATMEKDAYNSIRPDHKIGARLVAGGKAY